MSCLGVKGKVTQRQTEYYCQMSNFGKAVYLPWLLISLKKVWINKGSQTKSLGVASLGPSGMAGRIYVWYHLE